MDELYESLNAGDPEEIVRLLDPSIDLILLSAEPGPLTDPCAGHDGVRECLQKLTEEWDRIEMTASEVIEGEDTLLVLGRVRARGKAQGIRDVPQAWVWRIRGGRFLYGRAFADAQEAAREAGVEFASGKES